jgi:hypothetical protein
VALGSGSGVSVGVKVGVSVEAFSVDVAVKAVMAVTFGGSVCGGVFAFLLGKLHEETINAARINM